MDFRRIPFQFTTTDPLKRQEELQRRFGLPANKGNMYVDFANSGAMGTRSVNNSASNSPRLQHRVPIFVEGHSEPTKPSVDAQNVDSGPKPRVRVIPIEIEGEDNSNKRHRWLSGSSEPIKERFNGTTIPVETVKHPVPDPSPQSSKSPRVCNIPIKIEGSDHVQPKKHVKTQRVTTPESPKHTGVKLNGCSASKVSKVNERKEPPKVNEKKDSPEEVTLKKIQKIEEKLKGYHADVEKFSGTNKEKQYRYLDEMLTRCMLELDEIDTMGLDTIRLSRKAAVKKVQASIDLLESKIIKKEDMQDQVLKDSMEVEPSPVGPLEDTDMKVETRESEAVHSIENNLSADNTVEVTDALPEQINEKVESISIMETEEAMLKSDEKNPVLDHSSNESDITSEKMNVDVTEPVQITEVEAGVDCNISSEVEPIVEEPLSDSKDENAVDMDLDNSCEKDLKEPSTVLISEIESDAVSDNNKVEIGTSEQSRQNLEMEVAETSNIPDVTEQTILSSDNIKEADGVDQSLANKQCETSIDIVGDSVNVYNTNIPNNS